MAYRDDAREIHREARWTLWKFLPLFVVVVVALTALGFGLNSIGLLGRTIVERKVFEHSYQRSAALKERIATDEAALAEINRQLANPGLDEQTQFNLQAQAAAVRVRIDTARSQQ
jgi:hypothetical protein